MTVGARGRTEAARVQGSAGTYLLPEPRAHIQQEDPGIPCPGRGWSPRASQDFTPSCQRTSSAPRTLPRGFLMFCLLEILDFKNLPLWESVNTRRGSNRKVKHLQAPISKLHHGSSWPSGVLYTPRTTPGTSDSYWFISEQIPDIVFLPP